MHHQLLLYSVVQVELHTVYCIHFCFRLFGSGTVCPHCSSRQKEKTWMLVLLHYNTYQLESGIKNMSRRTWKVRCIQEYLTDTQKEVVHKYLLYIKEIDGAPQLD